MYARFDSSRRRWDTLSLKEKHMEEECKHDPDPATARFAEHVDGDTMVLDVWCKRCGKSGSTVVTLSEFDFDEPCEVKDAV